MRLSRRECLALGAAAAMTGAAAPASARSLDQIAQTKGLRFGTAVGVRSQGNAAGFDDARYMQLVAEQCGVLVHENELKIYVLKGASPNGFNFAPADRLAAFAKDKGLLLRGHTLLWNRDEFAPGWAKTHDFGGKAKAEAWLTDYITTVAKRYPQIQSWDVVNETIDPKTGEIRDTLYTRAIGPEVVEQAFHVARAAAPNAKLLYNDYMGHAASDAKHRAGVLKLLERLKARNVPIDALGVQGHIGNGDSDTRLSFGGEEAREWRRFMDEVKGMGLDVVITEFDVNDTAGPADPAARDAQVAAVGRDYLDMMVSYPELKQILAWGLSDKYTWLQTWWPRPDKLPKRPTPYDAALQPKPLRAAIEASLRAAPVRPSWG